MPSAAYVGRIGGLAVALGIGAAVVTGVNDGIAWADESGSTAGSTTSQAPSGTEQASEKPGPADVAPDAPAKSSESDEESPIATDDDVDAEEMSPTPEIRRKASKGSDRNEVHPAKPRISASASSAADDEHDNAAVTAEDAEDTIDQTEPTPAASPRFASTISAPLATSDTRLTSEPPASERFRPQPVGVVSRLLSGVVSAILSPFAANSTPGEPAGAPLVWSLLAFARREFEAVFAPRPLRDAPVDVVTTSATEQRTLILSAFPAEADAILARTTLDPNPTVVVDGRNFYLGSMGDKLVIVGMTGIGMENATDTTEAALAHFTPESGISIGAVVFSGVAGGSGRTQIGSVAVPARWTSDDGATWHLVDADMLAVADTLTVDLESTVPLGDPLCLCSPLARLPLFDLNREPQLFVGGDGSSDDNNNGTAFPAIPFGGDVFGPQPCSAPNRSLLFTGNFFQAIAPFLVNGLLSNLTGLLMPQIPPVDAVDQETAAAQQVAAAHGIPFLGIRGMSDGPGDPLGLPGYPFTFFVYRQLAADNAAIVTEAFMQSWQGP